MFGNSWRVSTMCGDTGRHRISTYPALGRGCCVRGRRIDGTRNRCGVRMPPVIPYRAVRRYRRTVGTNTVFGFRHSPTSMPVTVWVAPHAEAIRGPALSAHIVIHRPIAAGVQRAGHEPGRPRDRQDQQRVVQLGDAGVEAVHARLAGRPGLDDLIVSGVDLGICPGGEQPDGLVRVRCFALLPDTVAIAIAPDNALHGDLGHGSGGRHEREHKEQREC